jgi:hypothetical protein
MYPKNGVFDMSEDLKVGFGQLAQLFSAFARKGWGPREVTLLGQATAQQLENVRHLLQGRARIEAIAKRWWREGDTFVVPFPNEDRSGQELLQQDPGRFGSYLHLSTKEGLPAVERFRGRGEFVIVPCPFTGATYEEVLAQVLNAHPDLETVPDTAVLQLTAVDVTEMSIPVIVASKPFRCWLGCNVVWRWMLVSSGCAYCDTLITGTVGNVPTPWLNIAAQGYHFLLKRKAG